MDWYDVLESARRVSKKKDLVTSEDVARDVGVSTNVASAWLGKFVKWGYLLRVGTAISGKRWVRTYELTRWGKRFKRKA